MTEIMREMIFRSEHVQSTDMETFNTDHPTESWKSQK
jgi:purine-nucleoside phosphorylase